MQKPKFAVGDIVIQCNEDEQAEIFKVLRDINSEEYFYIYIHKGCYRWAHEMEFEHAN